jgi:hypothetical protein
MNQAPTDHLVNSRGMAHRINVSTRSLERHRANGLIPYIRLTKRTYLYDPNKVFKALEALEVPSRILKKCREKISDTEVVNET